MEIIFILGAIFIVVWLWKLNSTRPKLGKSQKSVSAEQTIEYIDSAKITARSRNRWTKTIGGDSLSPDGAWQKLREMVFDRDGHKCVCCDSSVNLTVDHIIEIEFGGTNVLANLRTLCAECHQQRHGREFLEVGFDPNDDYGDTYKVSPKVKALNSAMDSGQGLGIKYIDRQGLYSERVIYPKRIYRSRYVYIDAYCELDKANRVFRLSRLRINSSRLNFYDNATNSYTGPALTESAWTHGRKSAIHRGINSDS